MKTCILISTFAKYRLLAEWTARRIHAEWKNHPPIFYAGLEADGGSSLGFTGDSSDWMSVNLHAVMILRGKGFTYGYLVLDDHPPVGPCNDLFLNEELPRIAGNLGAAYVSLLGYGQHRRIEGSKLGSEHAGLEQSDPDYRWKFSLHPGLWNLESLERILRARMDLYSGKERSPWNFERHRDTREFSIWFPSFRVHGASRSAGGSAARVSMIADSVRRFFADCCLFFAKQTAGQTARDTMEIRLHWLYGHYQGPYPMFWSGCMRQGKVNRDFEKWVQTHGGRRIQTDWARAKAECFLEG